MEHDKHFERIEQSNKKSNIEVMGHDKHFEHRSNRALIRNRAYK